MTAWQRFWIPDSLPNEFLEASLRFQKPNLFSLASWEASTSDFESQMMALGMDLEYFLIKIRSLCLSFSFALNLVMFQML